ncbi:MAG: hypothetical protein Q9224_006237 [Gallowayella concinna]
MDKQNASEIRRILVYLRLESLPSLFTFISLLGGDKPGRAFSRVHPSKAGIATDEAAPISQKRPLQMHGLRMLELTQRLSSVMKESEIDDVSTKDPVVNSFHTFGQLNNIATSGDVEIVPEGSYAETLAHSASEQATDMILLPWSESGSLSESASTTVEHSREQMLQNGPHSQFLAAMLNQAPCHAAVFVNNNLNSSVGKDQQPFSPMKSRQSVRSGHGIPSSPLPARAHHIFFPFFGGLDDRTALQFVLRLAQNADVTATILYVEADQSAGSAAGEAVPGQTEGSRQHGVVKSWQECVEKDKSFFAVMKDSLSSELEARVMFETVSTRRPLEVTFQRAQSEVGQARKNSGDLIVLGRGREHEELFGKERQHLLSSVGQTRQPGSDVGHVLGDIALVLIATEVKASLLVIQAMKE